MQSIITDSILQNKSVKIPPGHWAEGGKHTTLADKHRAGCGDKLFAYEYLYKVLGPVLIVVSLTVYPQRKPMLVLQNLAAIKQFCINLHLHHRLLTMIDCVLNLPAVQISL